MTLNCILVHADAGPGVESRVRLAAGRAKHPGAVLIGAAARLPMPILEVYAGGAAMISAGLMDVADESAETAFKTAAANFHAWTADAGVETEWRSAVDFPAAALAAMSAAADLVVIGSTDGEQPFDAGDVIMKTGRPVLVVPPVPPERGELNADNVLVAWKNTAEARRAIADALPFLAEAKSVTLLHVGEEGVRNSGVDDAAKFLGRHGVRAVVEAVEPGSLTAAAEIVNAAGRTGAGLIVLGAYGHSRMREWAFGGVTRDLLRRSEIPCLFSR
jgi:nucleotide-binding universal stress UspA family protein